MLFGQPGRIRNERRGGAQRRAPRLSGEIKVPFSGAFAIANLAYRAFAEPVPPARILPIE